MSSLEVKDFAGGYAPAEEIVKGIDLMVRQSELVVIIGPNGAGKSTFLKMIAGLAVVNRGELWVNGTTVRTGSARSTAAQHVGFVPQERNVFGSMTVRENLEMGGYGLSLAQLRTNLDEQMSRFPLLSKRLRDRACDLSGGQRQLLAVAMALIADPTVLLLDEPTAGLSPSAAVEILEIVRDLAIKGLAVLMVEQNAMLALKYGTRGIVFVAGKKIQDTSADSLRDDDQVRHLFLGGAAVLH